VRVDKFPGIVTDQEPFEIGLNGFVTAENVDLNKTQKPSRREGYSSFYAGTIEVAWGDDEIFLFIEGGYLKSLQADASAEIITELSANSKFLTATRAYDDRLYWTTGIDSGVIEGGNNRPFGVLKPGSFVVEEDSGSMPEARYLLGLAYVNSRGVEGPLSYAVLDTTGGVTITIPHTPLELLAQDIEYVRMFVSYPDGEQPYRAGEIAVGDATYMTYSGDTTDLGIPAEAFNLSNMPVGGFIEDHGARIWTSREDRLYFSNPYSELTNLLTQFMPFSATITGIGSVSGGLYVGTTDAVYFMEGSDPDRMGLSERLPYGMIPGTLVKADGRRVGEGANTKVLLWATERGFCMGTPGRRGEGEVTNLTEHRVGTLTGHTGTAILRRANGQNHLMTVLRS
jgi:hypothetical protein